MINMNLIKPAAAVATLAVLISCGGGGSSTSTNNGSSTVQPPVAMSEFVMGADLSYINQMEDCGATYYENSVPKDPYEIMADAGTQVVRVRLWNDPLAHPPFPNTYSNIDDVEETIRRAKAAGMQVMLNFHYSDQWADPGKQWIPDAWKHLAGDTPALAQMMYDYSKAVIERLKGEGLTPEFVQVGNETNGNILVPYNSGNASLYPTDFFRQSQLLQAGIDGVRDGAAGSGIEPKVILHVAGPQNLSWWVSNINAQGIDYDVVGLSYYPDIHTGYSISQVASLISQLTNQFNRPVMLVETALPWSTQNRDGASNLHKTMPIGYGVVNPSNQLAWLIDLRDELIASGALGIVYWEPAWVSTSCRIEWGVGSNMENAGFFDFDNNLISNGGMQFMNMDFPKPDIIN